MFEIKKTATGYANTPNTLATFNGHDGADPLGSLIADAKRLGDTNGDGTVFEIKKTAAGYASAPTTLVSFNGANDKAPAALLLANGSGDLFGTTSGGGANDNGTVFEITDSGFATTATAPPPPPPLATVTGDLLWQNTDGQASFWDMHDSTLVGGGPVSPNPGPSWTEIGTGDFNHDGHADILWRNASGQAAVWDMNGNSLIGGGPVTPIQGRAGKRSGPAISLTTAFPTTFCFKTPAARPRSGK